MDARWFLTVLTLMKSCGRHLGQREAVGEELEDLLLPGADHGAGRRRCRSVLPGRSPSPRCISASIDEARPAGEHAVVLGRQAHGGHDLLDGAVLDQVADGAGLEGPGHHVAVGVHGEHHHGACRASAPWIRRVASTPSRTGMVTSISTTSGRSSWARRKASWPSAASPTTSKPCVLQGAAQALAQHPVVVGEQ